MTDPIIQVSSLNRSYRKGTTHLEVLRDLELEVQPGTIVAIRGRSGSGKTTLLNILGGLDSQFEGKVHIAGRDLGTLDDAGLSRYRNEVIGFVFQSFNLIDSVSCADNVMLPSLFARRRGHRVDEKRLREVLERVDLHEQAQDPPSTMSGGQRQRAAIARAILLDPRILLCDEPTGNLDSRTGARILELFTQLNEADSMTVVIVTHEDRVCSIAHQVMELREKRIA